MKAFQMADVFKSIYPTATSEFLKNAIRCFEVKLFDNRLEQYVTWYSPHSYVNNKHACGKMNMPLACCLTYRLKSRQSQTNTYRHRHGTKTGAQHALAAISIHPVTTSAYPNCAFEKWNHPCSRYCLESSFTDFEPSSSNESCLYDHSLLSV